MLDSLFPSFTERFHESHLSCFIYYDLATAEFLESVVQLPDVEHVIFIRFIFPWNKPVLTCVIQTGIICTMNVNIHTKIV